MNRLLLGTVLSLALVGCAQSNTIKVTGTVTLDGKPVDQAEVTFQPAEGRIATGVTDSQGRFELSTNSPGDGAVPGDHKVTISQYYSAGNPPPMMPGSQIPSRFPQKYGDPSQSPFTAKVLRGGKNDFQFDMKSAE